MRTLLTDKIPIFVVTSDDPKWVKENIWDSANNDIYYANDITFKVKSSKIQIKFS